MLLVMSSLDWLTLQNTNKYILLKSEKVLEHLGSSVN